MLFAFPNGIPDYNTQIEQHKDDILKMNLNYYLENGNGFLLHTPIQSTLSELNNKIVYLLEKTENGIWVVVPSSSIESSKFKFIFFNNRTLPTFGGISRIQHSPQNKLSNFSDLYQLFKKQELPITEINCCGQEQS